MSYIVLCQVLVTFSCVADSGIQSSWKAFEVHLWEVTNDRRNISKKDVKISHPRNASKHVPVTSNANSICLVFWDQAATNMVWMCSTNPFNCCYRYITSHPKNIGKTCAMRPKHQICGVEDTKLIFETHTFSGIGPIEFENLIWQLVL